MAAENFISEKARGKFFDSKWDKVQDLLVKAKRERVAFREKGMEVVRGTTPIVSWAQLIAGIDTNVDLAAPGRVNLDENDRTGTVGGGMNQLGIYNQGGITGYFKANQNQGPSEQAVEQANVRQMEALGTEQEEGAKKEYNAMANLNYMGEDLGMDMDNLQLQNRDLAMSRLDNLLGANIIARTELALAQNGEGSVMEGAVGRKAGEAGNYADGGQQVANQDTIDIRGGELQRQLSKLQIIDILARQVDRNQGNFYLATDGTGQVTKVTGIDNDMSFGSKAGKSLDKGWHEYPGISAYVDKEIALRVIRLKPEDIHYILAGLLPQGEIQQTINRLQTLQQFLIQLRDTDKLLEPNQWNMATSQGLIEEGKSYYARLAGGVIN